MPKFRKKPVVIEAVQWDGDIRTVLDLFAKSGAHELETRKDRRSALLIPTLERTMEANVGDWVILGIAGELYPCKPDIFAATYDSVDGGASGPTTIQLAPTNRPMPALAPDADFPRRNRVDLFSPAEKAIFDAQHAVEAAGGSVALTNATVLLAAARDYVADHVETTAALSAPTA